MELTKLSVSELKKLKTRVENEIAKRTDNTRKDLLKRIQKMTAEAGMSLTDVLGDKPAPAKSKRAPAAKKPARASKGKVAPKYRDPANANQTWTGRGRKPQWVAAHLGAGKPLEELLIK